MKKIILILSVLFASQLQAQTALTKGRLDTIWGTGQVPKGANNTNTWYTLWNCPHAIIPTSVVTPTATVNAGTFTTVTTTSVSATHVRTNTLNVGGTTQTDTALIKGGLHLQNPSGTNGLRITRANTLNGTAPLYQIITSASEVFNNFNGKLNFQNGLQTNTYTTTFSIDSATVYSAVPVGVGITSPASSSLLDLTSTTKAFLPPRMTTTQRDAIGSPVNGLFCYNSTTGAFNGYQGGAWGAIGGNISTGSLTSAGTYTLNLNSNSLTIKSGELISYGNGATAGTWGQRWYNSSSVVSLQVRDDGSVFNLGKGALTGNCAFGELALINHTTNNGETAYGFSALNGSTTSQGNTGVGANTLFTNTSGGDYNTAIGYYSQRVRSGQDYNVAVGAYSMENGATGQYNTALGTFALQNSTGDDNLAVGYHAAVNKTTGASNTFVGVECFGAFSGAMTGNIGLGYAAGYRETGSNKLFIGNQVYASEALGRTGSIIYGVMDATVANQRLFLQGSVMSGIASLATTATDGFHYIPTCAGTPTGTPTTQTGYAPMVLDDTNNILYIWTGAAWTALN